MFWKLCKFEIRSTYRSYFLIFSLLLVSGILMGFGSNVANERTVSGVIGIMIGLTATVYAVCLITAIILCLVNIIRNFHRTLFTRISYLTHTLPVKSWQIVSVKLISALLWLCLTAVVSILSVILIIIGSGEASIGDFFAVFRYISLDSIDFFLLFSVLFGYLIEVLCSIMFLYFIISFVYSCFIQKARIFIAIATFLVASFFIALCHDFIIVTLHLRDPMMLLWLQTLIYAIELGACFFGCVYLLDHKMEVE